MPLRFNKKWPRIFGFDIYGNGPCYVVLVEKGSMAHKAELMPGDQLLEVNGHDVTNMATEQVRTLVKNGSNQPPQLEVVSCLKTHVIKPHHVSGYGFKMSKKRPVTVVSVDYGGPAHQSGLGVGDIILEANSRIATGRNTLATVLSQQPGRLILLTIPVARPDKMVQVDKTLSRVAEPDSRIFTAKDLHNKLDGINDYSRKMAVVGALKQYAEDRDVTMFASTMNDLLRTNRHRLVLKHIRLLIPPAQRPQFDDLVNFERFVGTEPASGKVARTTHHMGQRKLIQVVREADSFGFVIKSNSPTFIESIDPGGAAEKAGFLPGDYLIKLNGIDVRRCDHDRLVQLLQNSGSCPTIEVLRCEKSGSVSTALSLSSSSSHNSVDNILYSNVIVDREGNTFTDKANFLLTSKELQTLKKAVRSYDMNRDIIMLYGSLSAILDTTSKKMLWPFLFILLTTPHREYVSHYVNMPFEVLMDIAQSDGGHSSDDSGQKVNFPESDLGDFLPSFKQQMDFLLTSEERLQFKKILEEYKSDHEINNLVKTYESILDTPSKKILWRLVLPHLISSHRDIIMDRLDIHDQRTGGSKLQFQNSSESSSDESDYSDSPLMNRKWIKSKFKSASNDTVVTRDHDLNKMDAQNALMFQDSYKADEATCDDTTDEDIDDLDSRHYVTIIPVGYPDIKQEQTTLYNHLTDSPQLPNPKKVKAPSRKYAETSKVQSTRFFRHDLVDHSSPVSSSSDDDSDKGMEVGYDLIDSKFSRQSYSTVSARQRPDETVLHEALYVDSLPRSLNFDQQNTESKDGREMIRKSDLKQHFQPPPPPPPLPLSSQSLPYAGQGTQESSDRMNVKRINWEKLDNKSVQNTIWEKLSDHDLSEVIRYLELETQFSTKQFHRNNSEKRKEVLIMDTRKAYNISILLGHLKMSVADVKKALYSMDEKTLSPELLGQLLAFAPNEHEISQYRLYKGDKTLLTQPDQFAYQMSLVEDYEARLKALKFKAGFKEKVEEIKQSLEVIKAASVELRNSKKLAHLLEIILAMGNHMNKGNSRVGEAAGFKITFLTQLDVTKTADKKSSFLHVLADAAYSRFPEVIGLVDELPTVEKAAKVSAQALIQDIEDLKKALQETSTALDRISNHEQHSKPEDQFREVMTHLLPDATDEIQSILTLQTSAMAEFSRTITFFGEDPKTMNTNDVFGIFSEFIKKFEKAHRQNLLFKRR